MTENFCHQRKLNMLFHVPRNREELVSPDYSTYTTEQLNMRRKVEILKYDKNINKNNKLTKKGNYARLARGNYKQNRLLCTNDYKIPVKSSGSDIPGPNIFLVEDKSVPLYNYNNTTIDRYTSDNGISYNNESDSEWTLYNFNDLLIAKNVRLSVLTIYDTVKEPSYTYTFKTPVYTNVYGTGLNQNIKDIVYTFTINYITLNVYYNDNVIYTQNSVPDIDEFSYTISPTNSTGIYDYNLDFYNGLITFENIVLPTSPGFNYEFKTNLLTSFKFNSDDAGEQNSTTINDAISSNVYINTTKTTFNSSNVSNVTTQSQSTGITSITAS